MSMPVESSSEGTSTSISGFTTATSAEATAAMTFTWAAAEELLGRWVVWVTSGVSMSGLSPSWVA